MDLIRDIADWLTTGWGDRLGLFFPIVVAGILGLYLLWLVVGYLRVSQVGLGEGHAQRHVLELPSSSGTATADLPRGIPYCSFDGLQYPGGATFCSVCERDLLLDCSNCGATLAASDASCYRCGTPTGAAGTTPAD
jgi:hypothetical protein